MLAELREQFLSEFVATARSRIKEALMLLPPSGPLGDHSAELIDRMMHTTAGEASMIGLTEAADAARAAQAAAKRCLSTQATTPLALVGCARALRSLARCIDALAVSAPSAVAGPERSTKEGEQDGLGRVLLVDDSPFNAAVLSDALQTAGIRATSVRDDLEQALAQLSSFRPQVVLIDAIMPNLEPETLCHQIRADPVQVGVRLLLFTALSDEEAATQARKLGVDGYVTKNLGTDAIVARVRSLLPGAGK